MYAVFVTVDVREGATAQFEAAITENRRATLSELGCHRFDLIKSDAVERRYHFYEWYEDAEAFTVAHRSMPHYLTWKTVSAETVERTEIVTGAVQP